MRVGLAADHGGFELKQRLVRFLTTSGHEVLDFGAATLDPEDDYPDLVVPLARAVAAGFVARGISVCGSGVGACIVANKIRGIRAALITEVYSAHQGVEHDDLNILCLGGGVVAFALACDLVRAFLSARYANAERHRRRLAKLANLESGS